MDPGAAFRADFGRRLRRRRLAVALEGARRGGRRALLAGLALLLLLALGVLPPPGGPFLTAGLFLAFLAAGMAIGVDLALRRVGSAGRFAAELDRVLGGVEVVPAALALAARRTPSGRFGVALLERAAAGVGALPRDAVGPLPRPPWGILGLALLVAFLIGLLPQGGFGILPGLGSGWGSGRKSGDPAPSPGASLELRDLARSHSAGEPVTLGAAVKGADLDLFVSVDGGAPVKEGTKGKEAFAFDLRGLPGMDRALAPGNHVVAGELRDASGSVVARAPDFEVDIDAPEAPEPRGGAGGEGETEPAPPPPSTFEEKVVRPLFGEGAEVEKRGKILVLDPEGSRGERPREVSAEEVVAEVRARAEDAARREGVAPRDAEAVRRYFEALRRLLEEKR